MIGIQNSQWFRINTTPECLVILQESPIIPIQFLMIFRIQVSDNRVLDPFCFSTTDTTPAIWQAHYTSWGRWRWFPQLVVDDNDENGEYWHPYCHHLKLFAPLTMTLSLCDIYTANICIYTANVIWATRIPRSPSVNILTQSRKSIEPTSGGDYHGLMARADHSLWRGALSDLFVLTQGGNALSAR